MSPPIFYKISKNLSQSKEPLKEILKQNPKRPKNPLSKQNPKRRSTRKGWSFGSSPFLLSPFSTPLLFLFVDFFTLCFWFVLVFSSLIRTANIFRWIPVAIRSTWATLYHCSSSPSSGVWPSFLNFGANSHRVDSDKHTDSKPFEPSESWHCVGQLHEFHRPYPLEGPQLPCVPSPSCQSSSSLN